MGFTSIKLGDQTYDIDCLPLAGGELTGKTAVIGQNIGAATISADLDALVIANKQTRSSTAGHYYPGIAFNHMWNWDTSKTYQKSPQAWMGLKLHSTPGSELSYLVFGTKEGTGATDRPIERMSISPTGVVNVVKSLTVGGTSVSLDGHTHTKSQITDFPTSLPASGGNADTVDNVHLEWSGSQAASSTDWLAGWNSDGTKIKAVKRADLSVNYATAADTATKLKTARSIGLSGDFTGSVKFDGSGDVSFDVFNKHCTVYKSGVNNKPYCLIAQSGVVTGSYTDKSITLDIEQGYVGGCSGRIKIDLRTDHVDTANTGAGRATWIYRNGYAADVIKIGVSKTSKNTYVDVFYKCTGSWEGVVIRQVGGGLRGSITPTFSICSSSESSSTSKNCWDSIENAATALHNRAYSAIQDAEVGGYVSYANSAGSAPASDVYDWAKASSKPSYSHNEITAGNLTIGDGANSLYFRTNGSWASSIYHHTSSDEAVVFLNKGKNVNGIKNCTTSWIFAYGTPADRPAWTGLTPAMQIKGESVVINKLLGSQVGASYNLDVNGSANATTLYENGTRVSVTGHTHTTISNDLSVTGKVSASSGFYESSDERIKSFKDPLNVDLEKLSKLRKNYFTFNDNPDKLEIGVSAQEIQSVYPEIVNEDENGMLSVAYDKLSVIALAAVDKLNERLTNLENKLEKLLAEK